MDIKELKQQIETNTLSQPLLILKYKKNGEFIIQQYIKKIANNKNIDIIYIDNVEDIPKKSIFAGSWNSDLFVLKLDDMKDLPENISENITLIIVVKKIVSLIKKKYQSYVVEVPELEDWQIKDYISSKCEGLTEIQIEELFNTYKNDLYRLDIELDKLKLFNDQGTKYNEFKNQLFTDVTNYGIFDLTNSIIQKDRNSLSKVYNDIEYIDVEPFGFMNVLISNFKKVIDVQLSKNPTEESTGLSNKQIWAIKKYSCGYYSPQELSDIFMFLTDLDYKIKAGELDTKILIDLIITKIMTK